MQWCQRNVFILYEKSLNYPLDNWIVFVMPVQGRILRKHANTLTKNLWSVISKELTTHNKKYIHHKPTCERRPNLLHSKWAKIKQNQPILGNQQECCFLHTSTWADEQRRGVECKQKSDADTPICLDSLFSW